MKKITQTTIDINEHFQHAHNAEAGAVVIFSGETRNNNKKKNVLYLEYEAHEEGAEKIIDGILDDAKKEWPLQYAFCIHRIGRVNISETSILVVTSSGHRNDAYEANRYILDRVKKEAPVWKREFFADGEVEWSEGESNK